MSEENKKTITETQAMERVYNLMKRNFNSRASQRILNWVNEKINDEATPPHYPITSGLAAGTVEFFKN